MAVITSPEAGSALLPRQIADMIFEDVTRTSIVQQLSRRVNLPATGVAIPVTATKPTAAWVTEGARKPASDATRTIKLMDPKKLATIVVFSEEFLRRDTTGLFQLIRPQVAEAFADAFDAAAIHGTNSPFTESVSDTTNPAVTFGTATQGEGGVYADIVAGLRTLADARKRLTGFAADPKFEPLILEAVDTTGRPLLVDVGGDGLTQRLLGRRVGFGEGVAGVDGASALRLVAGDWTKIAYGVGRAISYSVSRDATVVMPDASIVHLWQDNLVAVRAEAEYGLVIADTDAFVLYNETAAS